jgi:hypothetical protein
MANINELVDWLLIPVVLVVKTFFRVIFFILRPIIRLFNLQSVIVLRESQGALDKDQHEKRKGRDKR